MLCPKLPVPSLLDTQAVAPSWNRSLQTVFPTYAWSSSDLQPRQIPQSNVARKSPWRGKRQEQNFLAALKHWSLTSSEFPSRRWSSAVGTHHESVLELCGALNDPKLHWVKQAHRCPQIRLRAASRFLMRPVTMFALPSAEWLLFFSSPSRCSQVVMRSSIFNSRALKQEWLASLSHFRVTVWLPRPPNRSATRIATHGAAPFPGTDHCQGESVFRPAI